MAVYTHVQLSQMRSLLLRYDIGQLENLDPIADGVENTNYFLVTTHGKYVLTVFEDRVDVRNIPFFVRLINHLRTAGLPAPRVVSARDGTLTFEIHGKVALIQTFLQGTQMTRPSVDRLVKLGDLLARIHQATHDADGTSADSTDANGIDGDAASVTGLSRTNDMGASSWRLLHDQIEGATKRSKGLPAHSEQAFASGQIAGYLFEIERNWPKSRKSGSEVQSYEKGELPSGIGHLDLFMDNVLWTGEDITGVIDFYFAADEYFIYDLAVTTTAWCCNRETGIARYDLIEALLRGYSRRRELSPFEVDHFRLMCQGAAMRFFLSRAFDWLKPIEASTGRRLDPDEYLRRLHFFNSAEFEENCDGLRRQRG